MINPLEFSEREEVVNMSFIEIKGLSKIFLQGNQKIYGIRNVNISIERGTFMSVIGRSGSKSTYWICISTVPFIKRINST